MYQKHLYRLMRRKYNLRWSQTENLRVAIKNLTDKEVKQQIVQLSNSVQNEPYQQSRYMLTYENFRPSVRSTALPGQIVNQMDATMSSGHSEVVIPPGGQNMGNITYKQR